MPSEDCRGYCGLRYQKLKINLVGLQQSEVVYQ